MSGNNEAEVSISQKESAPFIKEIGNMSDKMKNGSKQEPSTFEENVKAAYGTKPRDPKTIGSNIKLKGGKEPTETEKLTLVSNYRISIHFLTFPISNPKCSSTQHHSSSSPTYFHNILIFSS